MKAPVMNMRETYSRATSTEGETFVLPGGGMREQGGEMATTERHPMPTTQRGAPVMESLCDELLGLGLPTYQARVLAALLQIGTANSVELARLSGIPRTSTYQVMEALASQGLVERLPTIGPAVWTCHGWKAVIRSLEDAGEQRMRDYDARVVRLRKILAALSTAGPSSARSKR